MTRTLLLPKQLPAKLLEVDDIIEYTPVVTQEVAKKENLPPDKVKYLEIADFENGFVDYIKLTKTKPFDVNGFMPTKFGVEEVMFKKERPLTLQGFKMHMFYHYGVYPKTVDNYIYNRNKQYDSYCGIIDIIRDAIAQDQIEGAMSGVYNANLVARINNLSEKIESKVEVKKFKLTMKL